MRLLCFCLVQVSEFLLKLLFSFGCWFSVILIGISEICWVQYLGVVDYLPLSSVCVLAAAVALSAGICVWYSKDFIGRLCRCTYKHDFVFEHVSMFRSDHVVTSTCVLYLNTLKYLMFRSLSDWLYILCIRFAHVMYVWVSTRPRRAGLTLLISWTVCLVMVECSPISVGWGSPWIARLYCMYVICRLRVERIDQVYPRAKIYLYTPRGHYAP